MAADGQASAGRRTVVGLGLATIAAYGVAYYSFGVLIDPIRAQTGWSTAALGAVFSAVLVVGGIGGIAGGRFADRAGVRPALLIAGSVGAGAMLVSSYQHQLVLFGAFYALGAGVIAALGFYHVTQPAAIRAATQQPERAVVWLTIFGALASPIFLPLTAALVSAVGWRETLRVLAAAAALPLLTVGTLVSDRPRTPENSRRSSQVVDVLRDAWRIRAFRRWVISSLISGAAVDVVLTYQVPAMVSAGLSIGAAATVAGLRGFTQLAGRVPLGPVLARIGTRRTPIASLLLGATGTLMLLIAGNLGAALAYTVLAGVAFGSISTLQGIYTNELVGQHDLSLLMGAQAAVFAIGGAAGPLLAGLVVAGTGSYLPVLLATSGGLLVAAQVLTAPRTRSGEAHAGTAEAQPGRRAVSP